MRFIETLSIKLHIHILYALYTITITLFWTLTVNWKLLEIHRNTYDDKVLRVKVVEFSVMQIAMYYFNQRIYCFKKAIH